MILYAADTIATNLNSDTAINILNNALSIGAGLPGIIGAIFVIIVIAIYSLIMINKAISKISEYFESENKRKEEAYLKSKQLEQEQAEFIERIQASASKSLLQNMDAMFKHDYDYYVGRMKLGKYDFFDKIPQQFWNDIRLFIDRTDLTPEEKAARIILIVRKKS